MKMIEAFQTTDGKVFVDKDEAKKHQEQLYFEQKIHKIMEKAHLTEHESNIVFDFIKDNHDILALAFLS